MENAGLEPKRNITLLRDQPQSGMIVRRETQSDIQVYKEALGDRFKEAKTVEECEKIIYLRQQIQQLDLDARKLDYAQKSADTQLLEAKQKTLFQRSQQVVASAVSIVIGIYFLQAVPLAGLLFLILGLAKPLGYSLGEISGLLDGLKGFPKDSDELLSSEEEQENQSEESRDARP